MSRSTSSTTKVDEEMVKLAFEYDGENEGTPFEFEASPAALKRLDGKEEGQVTIVSAAMGPNWSSGDNKAVVLDPAAALKEWWV
jgi:hypothetical protein